MQSAESGKSQGTAYPFPVTGIGASSGGLEALTQFFSLLPEHCGLAYVVIQHLDPGHKSELTSLLSKAAAIPVVEAEEGMRLQPDQAYVIPPGQSMTLSEGRLRLTPRDTAGGLSLPINVFMRSLADDLPDQAVGIILSGNGSDGAMGLAEIKSSGGITFAQDPASARNPDMPQAAIATGSVDYVMPPQEIARELVRLGRHPFLAVPEGESAEGDGNDGDISPILSLLRDASGVDFDGYRDTTLRRRIQRRMLLRKVETLDEYKRMLARERPELDALYGDVLINVTRFFRDPDVFEALKEKVFPEIHRSKSQQDPVRMWIAGCASGEEAYSLAIALVEFHEGREMRHPIRIFASDIDPAALETARAGLYPESIGTDVSPGRLARFFSKEPGGYRIHKSIRDLCVFARHDMTADTPFSRLDLISCRNVLIYLSPSLQRKVLPIFHYSLNPGGFLMMGSSESVGRNADLFGEVESVRKVFIKKLGATRQPPRMSASPSVRSPAEAYRAKGSLPTVADFQNSADRMLLRKYAPPGVLVNRDLDILQFRGRTAPFLEPPQGDATFNLAKMANQSLFLPIRSAIREAEEKGTTAVREGLRVPIGGIMREVGLEVAPIKQPDSPETCFLVLFHDSREVPSASPPQPGDDSTMELDLARARQELEDAREYMHTLREQYDAVTEEMKSSAEEMLSSNEEMQSTNEELETAKEELQATNEELTSLNDELEIRNRELNRLNGDLQNLLASLRIPIVMVGGDMRVRRYTQAAAELLRLPPDAIGAPLPESPLLAEAPHLLEAMQGVMASMTPFECELKDGTGRWYQARIHPYRIEGNRIDGAVMMLVDIDAAKRAEHDHMLFKFMCDQSIDPYFLMDRSSRFHYVNRSAYESLGYTEAELLTKGLVDIDPCQDPAVFAMLFDSSQEGKTAPLAGVHTTKAGKTYPVEYSVTGINYGEKAYLFAVVRNITEQQRSAEMLHLSEERLRQSQKAEAVGKLAGGVAHDFNNLLTAIYGYSDLSLSMVEPAGALHNNLTEIHNAGKRAAALTRQLLAYTRKQILIPRILNLNNVAQDMLAMLGRKIGMGIRVATKLDPELGMAYADPAEMDQVILHLVLNARDAMPKGGEIIIETRNVDLDEAYAERHAMVTPGPHVALSVIDTGIGMDEDIKARIFDPFFTTKPVGKGSGMGLSMVQGIISQSGGHISVHSAPGKGSTFRFYLPRVNASAEDPDRPEGRTGLAGGAETILLVEDEELVRIFVRNVLEIRGYTVLEAKDGKSALALLEKTPKDPINVLLTDVIMPGMTGKELAARFLEKRPGSPVLYMSGYTNDTVMRHGFLEPGTHFLQKPFTPSQLASSVRTLLDSAMRGVL